MSVGEEPHHAGCWLWSPACCFGPTYVSQDLLQFPIPGVVLPVELFMLIPLCHVSADWQEHKPLVGHLYCSGIRHPVPSHLHGACLRLSAAGKSRAERQVEVQKRGFEWGASAGAGRNQAPHRRFTTTTQTSQHPLWRTAGHHPAPLPSQEETREAERAYDMFTTAKEVHQTHDSNPDGEDPESGVVDVYGPGQKEAGAPEASSLLGQVSPSKKPSLH